MDDRENRTSKGGSRAAASRPKSATAQEKSRTSTGRPLNTGKTVPQNRSAQSRPGKAGSAGSVQKKTGQRKPAQRPASKKTAAKKKGSAGGYALDPVKVMGAAVIVGVILALLITMIMRSCMLRTHQIQTDFNAGDVFDINNYFEAGSSKAKLVYDNAEFEPEKLGKYTVSYKVVRGRMSKNKKGSINIVDDVSPYISGPDSIEIKTGSEINWSDYYSVSDADPDIQSKLKAVPQVDTSEAGAVTVALTVSDWAGNTSSKTITVNVE